MDYCIGDSLVL